MSGHGSDGTTTTRFPNATGGITVEMNPSSGAWSGHTTPITPTGSRIASVTFRIGVRCTSPSHLSAQAA